MGNIRNRVRLELATWLVLIADQLVTSVEVGSRQNAAKAMVREALLLPGRTETWKLNR